MISLNYWFRFLFPFLLLFDLPSNLHAQNTAWMNSCNGHGTFSASTKRCSCFDGWGSATDISSFKDPTCNQRICPAEKSWSTIPTTTTAGHAQAECSDRGTCDRGTGQCLCFDGFDGRACERLACPKRCSGHGDCMSIRHISEVLSFEGGMYPLTSSTFSYSGSSTSTTWDEEKSYGCLCHSSWPVGLLPGQSQLGEWYGPDCSNRRCPSGDDPYTSSVDETDCNKKYDNGASVASTITVSISQNVAGSAVSTTVTHVAGSRPLVVGDTLTVSGHTGNSANTAMNQAYTVTSVTSATVVVVQGTGMTAATYNTGTIVGVFSIASYSNKCHIECSNRGVCDPKIGVCTCFDGFHGNNCAIQQSIKIGQ